MLMNDSYVEYAVKSKSEANFYLGIGAGIICILLGLGVLLFDLVGLALVMIGIFLMFFCLCGMLCFLK